MRFVLYILFILTLFGGCTKKDIPVQNEQLCNFIDFYYYQDSTISLGKFSDEFLLVAFDSNYTNTQIRSFIAAEKYFDQNYPYTLSGSKIAVLKFKQSKSCEQVSAIIAALNQKPMIRFAHFTMKTDDCMDNFSRPIAARCVNSYSHFFYVKVKNINDLSGLQKMVSETKTTIVEQYSFAPQWFTLSAGKHSKGDALKMANYFRESGLFEYAHPEPMKIPVQ